MATMPQELYPLVTVQTKRGQNIWHMFFGVAEMADGAKFQPLKRGDNLLTIGTTADGRQLTRRDVLGPDFIDGSSLGRQVFLGEPTTGDTIVLWSMWLLPEVAASANRSRAASFLPKAKTVRQSVVAKLVAKQAKNAQKAA